MVSEAGSAGEAPGARPAQRRGDRRRRPTPRISIRSLAGGRRRKPRRVEEREGSFVDLYGWRLWTLLLWTAFMNVVDCFFTLWHLQGGGTELNPVAEVLLTTGRAGFVVWKSVLIALALLVLCLHKNFHLARWGLWVAAGGYTLLAVYHISLLAMN